MTRILKCFIIIGMLIFPAAAVSQVTARVAGLEENSDYMSLLKKDKRLHNAEDSVLKLIADARKMFAADTAGRRRYGADILRLEKELFEIRDSVGIVSSHVNRIEQDFIINNFGKSGAGVSAINSADVKNQKRNLIYNSYFKDNLSPSDYKALLTAQTRESEVSEILNKYLENYDTLSDLAEEYESATDKTAAAEIYAKYNTISSLNKRLEDSLSGVWGYIYDNKTYSYNFLLDKMNKTDLLSEFEVKLRDLRQRLISGSEKAVSIKVFAYPFEKRFVLSYEKSLADLLGYKSAADSLAKIISGVDKLSYNIPPINVAERVFIDYEDVEITSPSKYNNSSPIPENEIYSKGTVYKIQVGNFAKAQPVSVFRGAYPLSYDILEDGRHRYYAGAYRELAQAEDAAAKLKKAGFRSPEVVVWRDGLYENLTASASTSALAKTGKIFRVEIHGEGENMREDTKDIINTVAEGKELSRSISPEGAYVYTVGSFDNQEAANKLVERLGAVDGITLKVITVESPS